MTEEQLDGLGPALDDFLRPYLFCCDYTQTFAHLRTYCRGLLSELPRKSVEPIGRASGTAVRTLQEFLRARPSVAGTWSTASAWGSRNSVSRTMREGAIRG